MLNTLGTLQDWHAHASLEQWHSVKEGGEQVLAAYLKLDVCDWRLESEFYMHIFIYQMCVQAKGRKQCVCVLLLQ